MSSFLTTNFETDNSTSSVSPPSNDLGNFFQLNLPVGTVLPFAGYLLPPNFLWCDDVQYSTTTYSALFAAIGYTYGGSGNLFNVPNLTRKFPIGASNKIARTIPVLLSGNTSSLIVTGGNTIIDVSELASHTHDPPSPNIGIEIRGYAVYNSSDVQPNILTGNNGLFINSDPNTYVGTTGSVTRPAGPQHDYLQPFTVLNYIIKFN
jgi:microcystin-dependent protein